METHISADEQIQEELDPRRGGELLSKAKRALPSDPPVDVHSRSSNAIGDAASSATYTQNHVLSQQTPVKICVAKSG